MPHSSRRINKKRGNGNRMRLPVASLIMIMIAGVLLFMFIGFNNAFHSDGGLKENIWEAANNSLTGARKNSFDTLMPKITQGFGVASVLCFLLSIVFFVVEAFSRPPNQLQ